jgi:PAS domain S-box-containing protein
MSRTETKISVKATDETLAKLVQQLAAAEAALQAHLGAQANAIKDHADQPLLITQAQQKLIDSETLLRLAAETQKGILDAIPAHIALLDTNGVILVVNESWRNFGRVNGLDSPGFGVGTNYLSVCDRATGASAEEAPAVGQGIRRVMQGKLPEYSLEYPCHTPTEQHWFRLMVTPVSSEHRMGVVVMHIDVTERRMAENQLREQEQHQRQLAGRLIEAQAIGKVGSWDTDLKTMAVTWSEETHRIFGTDSKVFHPTHADFLKRVHVDDRTRVNNAFVQSAHDGTRQSIEHRINLPDGTIKVVEENWQVQLDDARTPVRAVGTCQDITERKTAEEERDRLFNHSVDMLCIAGFDGRLQQVNPAWTKCLGWAEAELTHRPMLELIHPDDRAATLASRSHIQQGNPSVGFENRYQHKNGTYRWLSWSVFSLPDTQQVFGVARDVTEQKMAADKIRDQLSELERWRNVTLGREDRILSLKAEVNQLLTQAGQAARYGNLSKVEPGTTANPFSI